MNKTIKTTALAMIASFGLTASAHAVTDIAAELDMTAQVNTIVQADGCQNSGGPKITLGGTIALGKVTGDMIFRNNVKGTHTAVVTDVISGVVLDLGAGITIPKQPSRQADLYGAPCEGTGTGGNPYIWVYLVDGDGVTPLTTPVLLGRCVQGLKGSNSFPLLPRNLVKGSVSADGCYNSPGPYIRLTGELIALRGIKARIVLKNNPNPPDPHTANCAATFDILFKDTSFAICKSPSSKQQACEYIPGAGGNPLISILLKSEAGTTGEIALGRCNKL